MASKYLTFGTYINTRMAVALLLSSLSLAQLAAAFQMTSPALMTAGQPYGNQILLPTNQVLTLAGSRIQFPGWPVDLALSPGRDRMAVLLAEGIQILSVDGAEMGRIPLHKTSFGGIVFTPDGQSVVAGELGKTDSVIAANTATGEVVTLASFPGGSVPAGVAASRTGDRIYVALNGHDSVAVIDVATKTILQTADTGVAPFGVALSADGTRLFVSNWGGRHPIATDRTANSAGDPVAVDERGIASSGTVSVFDANSLSFLKEIPVGLHPGSLQAGPDGRLLAVANGNSDSITLIDTLTLQILDTVPIPAFPLGYTGSSPTAVAFSPTGKWLYVACGGNNAVAVLERVRRSTFFRPGGPLSGRTMFRLRGYVPVDWYPVALAAVSFNDGTETVFAANAKGTGSHAEAGRFNARADITGTVVSFTGGSKSLATFQVNSNNNPFSSSLETDGPHLKDLGIDHVFYVIKENRTYDQILGDLGQGNGDPTLTQYGWNITPNHHRLAQEFVTLDNFYTSGVTSADGHQWVTQSFVTDYLERAFGRWPRGYPFTGNDPLAFASTGFIWDQAKDSGLSVRVFGEFTTLSSGGGRPWSDYYKDARASKQSLSVHSRSSIAAMEPIVEQSYPGWALNIPDIFRSRIFRGKLRAFDRERNLPNLVIIFLPNNHTAGLVHGYPTPASMVADNDLALGEIVEAITHSSYWPRSAIFVTEDDSQDGVDHIDGHRTVGLVISPFVKRGRVDSIYYNQTSMVRTIEELLGMPPMNKFDAAALPMRSIFTNEPDFRPFGAMLNQTPLTNLNPSPDSLDTNEKAAALESMAMDFTHPDAAPEDRLNRILWHVAKGWNIPYPAIPHRWGCRPDDDR
ncbi:MAG TPA: bifunctional YncE family protein/alkaline phosphatase family protein [Terriglobia bacterium]|nr:bifunctional YncE family protein/alkaline phosphatase family protein [Terriglobia bacterium]